MAKHTKRDDQESKTFSKYEVGKGGLSNAKKYILVFSSLKFFPSFQHTDQKLKDISQFDFKNGVHVCVYGQKHGDRKIQMDYENVKKRAEDCVKYYLLPFWSPMSPNCEHFSTKIMTGYGHSRQVERIGVFMRLLGDGLDPCSFFEQFLYIVTFQAMEPNTGVPFVSLIPEFLFLLDLRERERLMLSWQIKRSSDVSRNMFRYTVSFLIRWTNSLKPSAVPP